MTLGTVNDVLRNMRYRRRLTLLDVARRLGTTEPTMSQIEQRKRPMSIETEQKIIRVFGLSGAEAQELEGSNDLQVLRMNLADLSPLRRGCLLETARAVLEIDDQEAALMYDAVRTLRRRKREGAGKEETDSCGA